MIRIQKHMIVENEHLYGPGKRLLIYLKGCSLHCKGCINPHLWSFDGGQQIAEEEILQLCQKEKVDGITLHGGEPLDQAVELLKIVKLIKENGLSVILFTGYNKKELNSYQNMIWNLSDIVIAGRFIFEKRNTNLQFRGSTNQRVYVHKGIYSGYKIKDGFTTAIVTIDDKGNLDVNGFLTENIKKLIKNS